MAFILTADNALLKLQANPALLQKLRVGAITTISVQQQGVNMVVQGYDVTDADSTEVPPEGAFWFTVGKTTFTPLEAPKAIHPLSFRQTYPCLV